MPTRATRYSPLAQTFHWVIAGLIIVQFTLARLAEPLPLGVHKLALLARHKSVGMTILMLAVLRLLWRLRHPAPHAGGPAPSVAPPPPPPAAAAGHDPFRAQCRPQHARGLLCAAVRH